MISMLGGGLAVGFAVISILVIHGLHTGIWLTSDIVKAGVILLAIVLGVIAAAFSIQFERAETS